MNQPGRTHSDPLRAIHNVGGADGIEARGIVANEAPAQPQAALADPVIANISDTGVPISSSPPIWFAI